MQLLWVLCLVIKFSMSLLYLILPRTSRAPSRVNLLCIFPTNVGIWVLPWSLSRQLTGWKLCSTFFVSPVMWPLGTCVSEPNLTEAGLLSGDESEGSP